MDTLNKSDYMILGLLGKAPCSGYELKIKMAKNTSFYGVESNAQIYPVLKNLEKQGLVTSTLDENSGKRNKRIFCITKEGFFELTKWLETNNTDLFFYREDFLVKLSLGQHLKKETLLKMILDYKNSLIKKIEELNKMKEHVQIDHKGRADQMYLLLTYDHLEEVLHAKLKWCEKILKTM